MLLKSKERCTGMRTYQCQPISCSIVVSISACHADDPGSIPGGRTFSISILSALGNNLSRQRWEPPVPYTHECVSVSPNCGGATEHVGPYGPGLSVGTVAPHSTGRLRSLAKQLFAARLVSSPCGSLVATPTPRSSECLRGTCVTASGPQDILVNGGRKQWW